MRERKIRCSAPRGANRFFAAIFRNRVLAKSGAAALLFAAVITALNSAALSSPLDTVVVDQTRVPIIMYHKITKNKSQLNKWAITNDEFESDLKYLDENGFNAVFMSDLVNYVEDGGKLPRNPIVLTFDDGDASVYNDAMPLLKKYGMKAVIAVIGSATDECTEESKKYRVPHMTWPQIAEMTESGIFEVQNHSYDMHKGAGAAKKRGESKDEQYKRLAKDLTKMQARVTEMTGRHPNTFVYPFGAMSGWTEEISKKLGFAATLTCHDKLNIITRGERDSLIGLGRTIRPHGKSSASVFSKFADSGDKKAEA
jgi:peptidoglycan/xylan/chitin deacetylase (PgdA/CDA1 family)